MGNHRREMTMRSNRRGRRERVGGNPAKVGKDGPRRIAFPLRSRFLDIVVDYMPTRSQGPPYRI